MSEFLDHIQGLVRDSDSNYGTQKYTFAVEDVPERVVAQIVSGLPDNRQISFFDPVYPSRSDSGAYVSVRRLGSR